MLSLRSTTLIVMLAVGSSATDVAVTTQGLRGGKDSLCAATSGGLNYDLSALASQGEISSIGGGGWTYLLDMCGTSTTTCADGTPTSGMTVQTDGATGCYVLAEWTPSTMEISNADANGITLTFANGDAALCGYARTTVLNIACDMSTLAPSSFTIDESVPCQYTLSMKSKAGCGVSGPIDPVDPSAGGGGGPSGASGGFSTIFIAATVSSAVVYMVAGIMYQVKVKKMTPWTKESMPNREFWSDLPSLVKDGNVYAYQTSKSLLLKARGSGGYAAM